ncbi:MAG: hypothetical protein GY935_10670 [Gammaproteobacteria bacterium]|nr:hypothetical protein [Gammaproteobacteria bacterium]
MSEYNIKKIKAKAVAIGDSSKVNYSTSDREALLGLLEQIMEQLPANSNQHDAAEEHKNAIKRGEPHKHTGNWLEKLRSGTETGGKTVGLIVKALDLWQKMGGPGA